MKPSEAADVLLKVINVLKILDVPYYIGGSFASSAFGVPRSTLDADIAANIKNHHAVKLCELLKDEFYCDEKMMQDAIAHASCFNVIHLKTLFKIDIFVFKENRFDREVFSRRLQKPFAEHSTEELFWASPEDIILHKLIWYKEGGEVSDRQWQDILGVLQVQGERLDADYLERWAKELGVLELLKKARKESNC